MVEDEIRDGDRIASLLRAEIEGLAEPPFDELMIQPPSDGDGGTAGEEPVTTQAFSVAYQGSPVFAVNSQPDRIYLEFRTVQAAARAAAEAEGLRVRPKATRPPATLIFVERAADLKGVIDVLRACLPPQ